MGECGEKGEMVYINNTDKREIVGPKLPYCRGGGKTIGGSRVGRSDPGKVEVTLSDQGQRVRGRGNYSGEVQKKNCQANEM